MVASANSGSQTATISTEHYLGGLITTAGIYTLKVDLTNLANGDEVEIIVYDKCKSGSSLAVAYKMKYAHVQIEKLVYSIPVPVETGILCSITQTAGTGRTFDWNLLVA